MHMRFITNKIFPPLASLVFLLALFASQTLKAQTLLRPVAVVNDDVISLVDIVQRSRVLLIGRQQALSKKEERALVEQVLKEMIDERLKLQEADRLGIEIDDETVKKAFEAVAAQNGQDLEGMIKTLRSVHVNPDALREQFRSEIAWQRVIRRKFGRNIVISDQDIDNSIEQIQALGTGNQKRVFEIFLPLERGTEKSKVLQRAQILMKNLQDGANFSDMARSASESQSASFGGDLGWIQAGQAPAALRQAITQSPAGSLIGPLETKGGYYIIKVDQERALKQEERIQLGVMRVDLPINATFDEEQAAQSQIADIHRNVKSCKDLEEAAATKGDPGSGLQDVQKTSALAPAIQQAIKGLDKGQQSIALRDKKGLALYYVCGREAPSAGIDRLAIKEKLENDRLNILAERHLHDLRHSANIDIRL